MSLTVVAPARDTAAILRRRLRSVCEALTALESHLGEPFDALPDDVRGRCANAIDALEDGVRSIGHNAGLVRAGGGDAR